MWQQQNIVADEFFNMITVLKLAAKVGGSGASVASSSNASTYKSRLYRRKANMNNISLTPSPPSLNSTTMIPTPAIVPSITGNHIKDFEAFYAMIHHQQYWDQLDSGVCIEQDQYHSILITPFLNVIEDEQISGAITTVALAAIERFLSVGSIKDPSFIAHALVKCAFPSAGTPAADEVVLKKTIDCLIACLAYCNNSTLNEPALFLSFVLKAITVYRHNQVSDLLKSDCENLFRRIVRILFKMSKNRVSQTSSQSSGQTSDETTTETSEGDTDPSKAIQQIPEVQSINFCLEFFTLLINSSINGLSQSDNTSSEDVSSFTKFKSLLPLPLDVIAKNEFKHLGLTLLRDALSLKGGAECIESNKGLVRTFQTRVLRALWLTRDTENLFIYASLLRCLVDILIYSPQLLSIDQFELFICQILLPESRTTVSGNIIPTMANAANSSKTASSKRDAKLRANQKQSIALNCLLECCYKLSWLIELYRTFDMASQRSNIVQLIVTTLIKSIETSSNIVVNDGNTKSDILNGGTPAADGDSPLITTPKHTTNIKAKGSNRQASNVPAIVCRISSNNKLACKSLYVLTTTLAKRVLSSGSSNGSSSGSSSSGVQLDEKDSEITVVQKEELYRKEKMEEAVVYFNVNGHRNGPVHDQNLIASMIENRIMVNAEDLTGLISFFKNAPNINLTILGEYLARDSAWYNSVREKYIGSFNFKGKTIPRALKSLLKTFILAGEGQQVDRIMEAFGKEYFVQQPVVLNCEIIPPPVQTRKNAPPPWAECFRQPRWICLNDNNEISTINEWNNHEKNNPPDGALYCETAEIIFLLAFAITMLNTDLHHPDYKHKMSLEAFISNIGRIDDLKSLPIPFITSIYEDMKNDEISTEYSIGIDGTKLSLSFLERKLNSNTFEEFFTFDPNSTHSINPIAKQIHSSFELYKITSLLFNQKLIHDMSYIYLHTREAQTVLNCLHFFKSEADLLIYYDQTKLLITLTSTLMDFFQPILSFKSQMIIPLLIYIILRGLPKMGIEGIGLLLELLRRFDLTGLVLFKNFGCSGFPFIPIDELKALQSLLVKNSNDNGEENDAQSVLTNINTTSNNSTTSSAPSSTTGGINQNSKSDGYLPFIRCKPKRTFVNIDRLKQPQNGGWLFDLTSLFFSSGSGSGGGQNTLENTISGDDDGVQLQTIKQKDDLTDDEDIDDLCGVENSIDESSGTDKATVQQHLALKISLEFWRNCEMLPECVSPKVIPPPPPASPEKLSVQLISTSEKTLICLEAILTERCKPQQLINLTISNIVNDINALNTIDWLFDSIRRTVFNTTRHSQTDEEKNLAIITSTNGSLIDPIIVRYVLRRDEVPLLKFESEWVTSHQQNFKVSSRLFILLELLEALKPRQRQIVEQTPNNAEELFQVIFNDLVCFFTEIMNSLNTNLTTTSAEKDDLCKLDPEILLTCLTSIIDLCAAVGHLQDEKVSSALLSLLQGVDTLRPQYFYPVMAQTHRTLAVIIASHDYKDGIQSPVDQAGHPTFYKIILNIIHRLSPICICEAIKGPENQAPAATLVQIGHSLITELVASDTFSSHLTKMLSQEAKSIADLQSIGLFTRYLAQTFLIFIWPLYGLVWDVAPQPDPALFDVEDGTTHQPITPLGSNPQGGTSTFFSHSKQSVITSQILGLALTLYAKVSIKSDGIKHLWELWAPVAQILTLLAAFGSRRERRTAMMALPQHLKKIPFNPNTIVRDWLQTIEYILIPQISLNFTNVYPFASYPFPIYIPSENLNPADRVPEQTISELGQSLIHFMSLKNGRLTPCPVPYADTITSVLIDSATKFFAQLPTRAILLNRKGQSVGDVKRLVLSRLELLFEPLDITAKALSIEKLCEPDIQSKAEEIDQTTIKDNQTINEATTVTIPISCSTENGLTKTFTWTPLCLYPALVRLLRIFLHEMVLHECNALGPESLLEAVKTLLIVLGTASELQKLNDAELERILEIMVRQKPESLVTNPSLESRLKSPAEIRQTLADAYPDCQLSHQQELLFMVVIFLLDLANKRELLTSIMRCIIMS